MSRPGKPDPAKLFMSIIYSNGEAMNNCLDKISDRFGPTDYSTRELPFNATDYYVREMGAPLKRRYLTFKRLVDPGDLTEIKLFTNVLENEVSVAGMRRVNLDPGLLSMNNLVLATGKGVAHRPYLGRGIYADLTLVFENGSFNPLPWTYRDYATPEMIGFLNRIRKVYKADLKELRAEKINQPHQSGNGETGTVEPE